ncbi:SLC13 family permease [Calderihabitans maritimus]|uniref:Sodium-dependent dicarboxylate transporter SdcS n=1 Tax=Calderihabitans maritimus TaxID=1246530 RepID=A0A1Z5HPK5_9FIRM|nr:SLC13 family permease [Calderihabitans maritimus]GAW91220.1 anion transporter [Calderihabitans maritimus]
MSSVSNAIRSFWQYMWTLHVQTKRLLKLDFTAAIEQNNKLSEKEKKLAKEVLGKAGGDEGPNGYGTRQKIGLILGPVLFVLLLILPLPDAINPETKEVFPLTPEARGALASAAWIATWWITEAIPIPATSLLPIVLFPLTKAMSYKEVTPPYAHYNIYLFMGGFFIAVAMERWNLHRRIALNIIRLIGTGPNRIVLGFMVATAFLSMWISNTATTMMMTPIGLAVILQVASLIKGEHASKATAEAAATRDVDLSPGKFNFGTALMLGIAYAASIGGVATIIGTPPNNILVAAVEKMFGQEISFARWMMYGVPIAVISLILTWIYLVKVAFPIKLRELPGGMKVISEEIKKLGPMSKQETQVLIVFTLVALAWITRKWLLTPIFPKLGDPTIAILGALVLFLIPVDLKRGKFLLDWETAVKIPWGILLLFGGGIALADGFKKTGLANYIAYQLAGLEGASMLVIAAAVVTLTIFLTEVTSNTATASMMMPIMAAMAVAMGIHPYALMITAAIAASFAFMLPVATPPNAIVFGTGYVTIPQMAKAGFWLNIMGIILITGLTLFYLPVVWGIDFSTLPSWAILK